MTAIISKFGNNTTPPHSHKQTPTKVTFNYIGYCFVGVFLYPYRQ